MPPTDHPHCAIPQPPDWHRDEPQASFMGQDGPLAAARGAAGTLIDRAKCCFPHEGQEGTS
jgi:hypothetical protein